jgi:hypothetical protein
MVISSSPRFDQGGVGVPSVALFIVSHIIDLIQSDVCEEAGF